MTCYKPLQAYRSKFVNEKTGKRSMVFSQRDADDDREYSLPCGQCIGCRLDYSRQWAIRCMHESSLYEDNCFITLTYNDEFLPKNSSLNYDHWTKFMKRLRFQFSDVKIRFFMGPEYGEKSGRPHYHALLFNFDFSDKVLLTERNGHRLYVSDTLNSLWSCPVTQRPYGFASVGTVTFESAAYVARYMMKKVKGDDVLLRYFTQLDPDTGEIIPIEPEKARMSRMPGLATEWFNKFHPDVYPSDEVVMFDGRKSMPPKFYDNLLKKLDPYAFDFIKEERVNNAAKHVENNTRDRLDVRRVCKERAIEALVRNIDL